MIPNTTLLPPHSSKNRDRGAALLIVVVLSALIATVSADFAYSTHLRAATATHRRDQLRAEYEGARSALAVGQLVMQLQTQLHQLMGNSLPMLQSIDLGGQTPLFMSLLQNQTEQETTRPSVSIEIRYEDGSFPISCVGGLSPDAKQQQSAYTLLSALFTRNPYGKETRLSSDFSDVINRAGRDGLALSPLDLPRWIIDWVDYDSRRFDPRSNGAGAEEAYDRAPFQYPLHNHYLDTRGELRLIRGMEQPSLGRIALASLTPYSRQRCKISVAGLSMESWPLLAATLATSSSTPASLLDPNTAEVAKALVPYLKNTWSLLKSQSFEQFAASMGFNLPASKSFCPTDLKLCPKDGTSTPETAINNVAQLVCSPAIGIISSSSVFSSGSTPPSAAGAALQPIPICPAALAKYLTVPQGNVQHPVYTLHTRGEIRQKNGQTSRFSLEATFDSQRQNTNPICAANRCNRGAWLYFRVY